jgi:RND family efflux transporter MFP subunit
LNAKRAVLKLQQEGNRRQDIQQARETVKQAEETLRQANAARATDEVKRADLRTAMAGQKQNNVKFSDIDAAKASLEEALSAVAIAQQALGDAVVRSPIAGRMSERMAEPGQLVSSATILFHVVSLNSVYFEPAVSGADLASIKVGQPVYLRVDTYPNETFVGSITKIYPQSSSDTRTTSLRVTLPNSGNKLRPNMFAQGTIVVRTHRNVMIVPTAAVITKDDKHEVFVVDDGIVHVRNVTAGITTDKGTSVELQGLVTGASVITSGQTGLEEGQKVQTVDQTAGTDKGGK